MTKLLVSGRRSTSLALPQLEQLQLRRRNSLFARFVARPTAIGPQLYHLSGIMNSEDSFSVTAFLSTVSDQLRYVKGVSLYLCSESDPLTLEHYVSLDTTAKYGLKPNHDLPDISLTESSLVGRCIATNNGTLGFFVDKKRRRIDSFSLEVGDFVLGRVSFNSESGEGQKIIIPLKASDSDRLIGCIILKGKDLRLKGKFFMLSSMAFLASAARNLYALVARQLDPLTKLLTRDIFFTSLISYADRYISTPAEELNFSFGMSDIDYFRNFNEKYGHPEGDRVLRKVALVTRATVRERKGSRDLVGRYGGEENMVLLGCDQGNALSAISRVRRNIKDKTDITASFGVVDARTAKHLMDSRQVDLNKIRDSNPDFDHVSEAKQLIMVMVSLADQAMYYAKDTGKDRICYARKVRPGEQIFATHESG
ncbi:MAG: GGDEF domain-containing protein [Candidatus Micrarchaeota archaeon]